MADLAVVEELQTYLVAQGVAQLPATAASLTVPSIWLAPRDGAPAPRSDKTTGDPVENATITIVDTFLSPAAQLEAWIEEAFVDVIVIARQNPMARLIHRTIRGLIHPIEAHGGRMNWMMGALLVEYSTIWRGDQPLYQDKDTYSRVASYRFGARRKMLAGSGAP